MRRILAEQGIEYKNEDRYTTECPKCGSSRKKKGTKTLSVSSWVADWKGSLYQYVSLKCFHDEACYGEKTILRAKIHNNWDNAMPPKSENTYVYIPANKEIIIPLYASKYKYCNKNGDILFYIVRTKEKKFYPQSLTDKGVIIEKKPLGEKFKTLYGAELLHDDGRRVLVVEGEKTADAARKIFHNYDVVTWQGGANNVANNPWKLIAGRTIILWPDNDEEGIKAMHKLSKILDSPAISIVDVSSLPPKADLSDPIDLKTIKELYRGKLHIKHPNVPIEGESMDKTIEGLYKDKIDNKSPLFPDQVSYAEMLALITKEKEPKFFGFSNMDGHLTLPNSGVVVVEARSGHGKSVFLINLALRLLRKTTHNMAFVSYEVPKQEAFLRMLMAAEGKEYSGVTYKNIAAYEDLIRAGTSKVVTEEMDGYFNTRLWVTDHTSSIADLTKVLDNPVLKKGIIFIDYLQIIPTKGFPYNSNRYQVVKDTVETLRELALRNEQVIIVGSQVTIDGDNPVKDFARESKDILFTSALTLQVWNKHEARVSEAVKIRYGKKGEEEIKEDYFDNIPGNFTVIVKKARLGQSGQKFGFNLRYGCLLEEAEPIREEF